MSRLRVGVYDLYWATLGGGEQVAGTIAAGLAPDHDVTLLGPEPIDLSATERRLGLDLARCDYLRVRDDDEASMASEKFDVFVNGTYLSRAASRSRVGWYYIHFPRPPRTRTEVMRQRLAVGGVTALRALPRGHLTTERLLAGLDRRVEHSEYLGTYDRFLANSQFTSEWTRRLFGVKTDVLYPPVRTSIGPGRKDLTILNMGRFFDPRLGHSKKQLELVEAFGRLGTRGWRLQLVGGCDPPNREYALAVRRRAVGKPIDVHVNASGQAVGSLLAAAPVYWHASGLGEDPSGHPERFEHFGIAVVEAMAAGAVPVVYGAAGPAEIVRDGIDGFHFGDVDELIRKTSRLIAEPELRAAMATSARQRALEFSADRFLAQVRTLLGHDAAERLSPNHRGL